MMRCHAPTIVHRQAVDDGKIHLSPEHIAHLGCLAHQRVHGHPRETEGAFDNGTRADCRGPHRGAKEGVFREWAIPHPLCTELCGQPTGRPIHPLLDVLTHDEHPRIASHLLAHGLVQRLGHGDLSGLYLCLCHIAPPVRTSPYSSGMGLANMSSKSSEGSGYGLCRANSTASSISCVTCASI